MSTVVHERCVCALGTSGLFALSLAWDFWGAWVPAGLVLELSFLVRCTVEVARGTGRRRKKGRSRGFTLMEPWLLQPPWFVVETGSLQIYFPASRAGGYGYRCTGLDLDRYDHGVEGLDWLLLVPVGSGAAMCASSSLDHY